MVSEENAQTVTRTPVGSQLRQAREEKGLSAADIAKAQHLRPAVIQSIEAGDYEQIDSELFLKGYVRAYARQVGLDPNSVIADLDGELEPLRQQREQEFEANPLVDIERRRRRKRRLAKVALLLCVAALAGYLVFAFVLPHTDSTAPSDLAAEGVQEPSGDDNEAIPPATGNDATADQALVGDDAPLEPAADPVASGDVDELNASAEEPVPEDAADLLPVPVDESEVPDQTADAAELESPVDPAVEDPTALDVATDTGRLQITFTGDCWVQVSDASGNRLVNSLQRNGDQIDVSGKAPFRVVIGAVDAIGSIRFQGDPVDISGYRVVNNRSEFTLTI